MMHGDVSRLLVASVLLMTACPLDPGEGTSPGGNETGEEDTTGGPDPTAITMTTATTVPSTSSPTTTETPTTGPTTSPTEPTAGETDVTGTTDPTTGETDESGSGTTGMLEGRPVTIQEIRMGDVDEDTVVEVSGAICTAVAVNGFFMQDPEGGEWSGIWVFTGNAGPFPELGDVVSVVGTYEEFFNLSQIATTGGGSMTVTESPGEGNVPAPETLEILEIGESWESVLVRVANDTFTVVELSDVMNVNEFLVEDSGMDTVWVDDFIYDVVDAGDLAGWGIGASFDAIQGPLNFSFDEFKIAPRTVDDLSNYMQP